MMVRDWRQAMKWFNALSEDERVKVLLKIGTRDHNKIAEYWAKYVNV